MKITTTLLQNCSRGDMANNLIKCFSTNVLRRTLKMKDIEGWRKNMVLERLYTLDIEAVS